MSGHNKWSKIKRKKGESDVAKAKIFTKISREIVVAVKAGGSDINSNARLRDILTKARVANIPSDNVMRSIKKASGEALNVNYESIVYEGYGIGGSAVIVETLTDNKNRTAGEIRHIFDKYGGSLGTTGSVAFMFDTKGVIVVDKDSINSTEEDFMLHCIECGAEDFLSYDSEYIIYTKPIDISNVKEQLEKINLLILNASVDRVATNTISLDGDKFERFEIMLEKFEENDDVQNVYHNVD